MDPSDLVVVESGASWTKWIKTRESPGLPMISLLQERDEAACDFAARVRARLERLSALGPPIARFTLVGGEDWTIPTLQARLAILRNARESGLPGGAVELTLQTAKPAASGSESRA